MAVQSWGREQSSGEDSETPRGTPSPARRCLPQQDTLSLLRAVLPQPLSYLQAAVHHAHYEVELLVVQHSPVLLHVQVQLLGQAVPGCSALHGSQHGREELREEEQEDGARLSSGGR